MDKLLIPFDREAALTHLKEKVQSDWLIKHCIASGAVMRACAQRLGEDPAAWEVLGIIHDIDFDITADDPARHTLLAAEWMRAWGFGDTAVNAILAHNEMADHDRKRESRLEFALSACESITGLIVATALIYPDKKISSVKPSSIVKRMKEKAFARKVSREDIMQCEQLGIPLPDFCAMAVTAMQGVSDQLGL